MSSNESTTTTTTTTSATTNNTPSLISSHTKYAQGAVASTLGYESGEQTKKDAVDAMRAVSEESKKDASSGDGYGPGEQTTKIPMVGTVEKKLGQVAGCEGLVEDGKKRIPDGRGIEEQSGTG